MNAYDFTAKTLDGRPAPLAEHRGQGQRGRAGDGGGATRGSNRDVETEALVVDKNMKVSVGEIGL